jgi:hypothetical protein
MDPSSGVIVEVRLSSILITKDISVQRKHLYPWRTVLRSAYGDHSDPLKKPRAIEFKDSLRMKTEESTNQEDACSK